MGRLVAEKSINSIMGAVFSIVQIIHGLARDGIISKDHFPVFIARQQSIYAERDTVISVPSNSLSVMCLYLVKKTEPNHYQSTFRGSLGALVFWR